MAREFKDEDATLVYFDGEQLSESAHWDVELTDDEVAALAEGVSPMHVRPEHLVEYRPPAGLTGEVPNG